MRFIIISNKYGQLRLLKVWNLIDVAPTDESSKTKLVQEVIKKCLSRDEKQCTFVDYKDFRLIYRKYATLSFIVGAEQVENELAILEFIQSFVEILSKHFENVCEMDIMFNLDKVLMILDEMIVNGQLIESNQGYVLAPLQVLEQFGKTS